MVVSLLFDLNVLDLRNVLAGCVCLIELSHSGKLAASTCMHNSEQLPVYQYVEAERKKRG